MRFKNKFTKISALALSALLLLTACTSDKGTPLNELPTSGPKTPAAATSSPAPSDENKDNANGLTDTPATTEAPKLSFEEIEQLAQNCVYHVHWYSKDGDFSAGTAFIMDSKDFDQKVLVTAFHFLVPDEAESFTGSELPDYLYGGEISYAKSGEDTGARLKNNIVLADAAPVPTINKDVAAFTMHNGETLNTLPLSTHKISLGEKLYLLANLWDTDDVHENCVYECTAYLDQNGEVSYKIDEKYGTAGASGGPIVNEYGEVVAIHMAQGGSLLYGHSASSFSEQISAGTISSVTYPEDLSEFKTPVNEEDETETVYHADDMSAETEFFNLKINSAVFSDKLENSTPAEGFKYLTLDISFDTRNISEEDVFMSNYDFAMIWSDSYAFPTEIVSDIKDEDGILLPGNSESSARIIFEVPANPEYLMLYCPDYYYDSDNELHTTAEHYFNISTEGF